MSMSSFRAVVRNAGNLESENKTYGSFRSLNKFEPNFEPKNRDNIFEKFDIDPIKNVPPQPPISNEERRRRKKNRRQREATKENDSAKNGRESKLRSLSKEEMEKNESSKEPCTNERDSEEKIRKAMTRVASKRQKRAERNHLKEAENLVFDPDDLDETGKDRLANKELIGKRKNSSPKLAFQESKPESDTDDEKDAKIEIDKIKTGDSNQIQNKTLVSNEFFESIRNGDTLDFTLSPPPQGQLVHGKIICKKGLFNEYFFYLENFKKSDLYIMKASRKMTSTKIYYTIDTINYDQFGEASTTEISCAKIVSNMSRKKFKLDLSNNFVQFKNTDILDISFKNKPGDPRKILASASLCQGAHNINNDKVTYFLKNKQPVFKMDIKRYVLNYNGRAKISSKNNFQIIDETSPEDILTQLGKVEDNVYHCDFAFPISAMQAFGFALANLCK